MQLTARAKITHLHKQLVPVRLRIWDRGLEIANMQWKTIFYERNTIRKKSIFL